jgi:hypothetical protein
VFITKGRVLQGMSISLVGMSYKLELCRIPISTVKVELSKAMGRIGPEA